MRHMACSGSTTHHIVSIGDDQLCLPPVRALTSGIKTRLQRCFDNLNLPLSPALHGHLKQFWLARLEENEFDFNIEVAKKNEANSERSFFG